MSNHLAIATVTAAIGQLAHAAAADAVGGVGVRYGRPNATDTGGRVNVYLYQIAPSAALRNNDLPTRDGGGRLTARPRAALDLHYLLSFYGDAQAFEPDRMAGAVARDLHARPVLDAGAIAAAISSNLSTLGDSDLGTTLERVSITPLALSLDDLSRLWSVLVQAPHALSIAYRAGVVVIDARESAPAAAPVLRRGEDDRGAVARTDRVPRLGDAWVGFPAAETRQPRQASLGAAALGLRLRVSGTDLDGDTLTLTLRHPARAPLTIVVPPEDRDSTGFALTLPDDIAAQTAWAAGLYAVTATVTRGDKTVDAPVWPLLIAPKLIAMTPNPAGPVGGALPLTVTTRPLVGHMQRALLRVGGREAHAEPRIADANPLVFVLDPAPALTGALARLTVDGAESTPVALDPVSGDFVFDDAQRLTIA